MPVNKKSEVSSSTPLAPWAERMRTARLALGRTQEEFARQLGITREWCSVLERGLQPVGELIQLKVVAAESEAASHGEKGLTALGASRGVPILPDPMEIAHHFKPLAPEPGAKEIHEYLDAYLRRMAGHPHVAGHVLFELHRALPLPDEQRKPKE